MTTKKKLNKNFISEIDKRLTEFDKNAHLSDSQIAEIRKYQQLYHLRDNVVMENKSGDDLFE